MYSRFLVFLSWLGSVRALDLTCSGGGRLGAFFLFIREDDEEGLDFESVGLDLEGLVGAIFGNGIGGGIGAVDLRYRYQGR